MLRGSILYKQGLNPLTGVLLLTEAGAMLCLLTNPLAQNDPGMKCTVWESAKVLRPCACPQITSKSLMVCARTPA